MATVKTERCYFGKKEVRKVVRFKARAGKFYISLPPFAVKALDVSEVQGDTLAEVEKEFDDLNRRYSNVCHTDSKVILYQFESDARIERNDVTVFDGEGWHDKGVRLSVACGVYDKHEWAGNAKPVVQYESVESSLPEYVALDTPTQYNVERDAIIELPWTEEREQFFANLIHAIEELVLRLNSMSASEQTLLGFIASKQLLLPAATELDI